MVRARYSFTDGELNPPADPALVEGLSSSFGVAVPDDYLNFLREHNGGEGFIGTKYLIFWKAEELVDFNRQYEVEEYAPGILLFGSSGGGEGYGFDTQAASVPIVRVPFIGMDRDSAEPVAKNLAELFAVLAASQ